MANSEGKSTRRRGISLAAMTPLVGLFLLLVLFSLLGSHYKGQNTGIIQLEKLPATTPIVCWKGISLEGMEGTVISLNSKDQVSFALPSFDKNYLKSVILELASLHKVNFTASQKDALENLPYLAMKVQELPGFLDLTLQQQLKLPQQGIYNSLDSTQLTECIKISRTLARTMYGRYYPPIYLKIEPSVQAPRVEHLMSLLNAQGTSRFNLLTQSNGIDYPLNTPLNRTQ